MKVLLIKPVNRMNTFDLHVSHEKPGWLVFMLTVVVLQNNSQELQRIANNETTRFGHQDGVS